jgi:hypothetical protein
LDSAKWPTIGYFPRARTLLRGLKFQKFCIIFTFPAIRYNLLECIPSVTNWPPFFNNKDYEPKTDMPDAQKKIKLAEEEKPELRLEGWKNVS